MSISDVAKLFPNLTPLLAAGGLAFAAGQYTTAHADGFDQLQRDVAAMQVAQKEDRDALEKFQLEVQRLSLTITRLDATLKAKLP